MSVLASFGIIDLIGLRMIVCGAVSMIAVVSYAPVEESIMVYLSRIYTKTGDLGDTGLGDGSRVPKDHPRVTAYGSRR